MLRLVLALVKSRLGGGFFLDFVGFELLLALAPFNIEVGSGLAGHDGDGLGGVWVGG